MLLVRLLKFWPLIVQSIPNFPVHIGDDLYASLMLLHGDDWCNVCGNLVGELDDVHLVSVDCVWQFLVAVEKDLLNCFFT